MSSIDLAFDPLDILIEVFFTCLVVVLFFFFSVCAFLVRFRAVILLRGRSVAVAVFAAAVVGDVPAHAAPLDLGVIGRAQLVGAQVGEGRQADAVAADEGIAFADDLVDARAFHGISSRGRSRRR